MSVLKFVYVVCPCCLSIFHFLQRLLLPIQLFHHSPTASFFQPHFNHFLPFHKRKRKEKRNRKTWTKNARWPRELLSEISPTDSPVLALSRQSVKVLALFASPLTPVQQALWELLQPARLLLELTSVPHAQVRSIKAIWPVTRADQMLLKRCQLRKFWGLRDQWYYYYRQMARPNTRDRLCYEDALADCICYRWHFFVKASLGIPSWAGNESVFLVQVTTGRVHPVDQIWWRKLRTCQQKWNSTVAKW